MRTMRLTQEGVVFLIALVLFVGFAITLTDFVSPGNLMTLLRSVAILGILGLGMGLVVVGRGIDLSMVAVMVVAVSWAIVIGQTEIGFATGILAGLIFCILTGLVVGVLVAYAEVPAIFTTLAMGSIVYGIGRSLFFTLDVQNVPPGNEWFAFLGRGTILGIPMAIIAFGIVAAVLHLVLRKTRFGRFIYASGDNPQAARIAGLPYRPLLVTQYVVSSCIAYVAGLVMAASVSGMNTRIFNSTMIYDVLLVVVLGGIGLAGGRGGVRNVIVGTLLVGVLLNGMTIMNISLTYQNLIKSVILLMAILIDTLLNPRDEQTSQQGDI
nr:ABC transporter permease [Mesorhizobium sp.]